MIEKYERVPEWLRWILLLPLCIIFSFLAILLLSLLRDDFVLIHSIVAIVSFAVAIYTLAPRWKSGLVMTSLILRMVFSIAMVSLIFFLGETPDRTTWYEMGREVLGWIAGWTLYFSIFRNR
ncbi:MAG: hypothetical protein ACOY90_08415 [Candidatus Zhuqueibacterota bacterium]